MIQVPREMVMNRKRKPRKDMASADRPPENENDSRTQQAVADDFESVSDRLGVGDGHGGRLGGQSPTRAGSQGKSDPGEWDQEKQPDVPPLSLKERRLAGMRSVSKEKCHRLDRVELVISENEEARRGTDPGGLLRGW